MRTKPDITFSSWPLEACHILPYLQVYHRRDVGHNRYRHLLGFNLGWLHRDVELRIYW